MAIDRKHCLDARNELKEHNDCSVRACAIAANIPYADMRQYLKDECGRERGEGLYQWQYHRALQSLGYKLTKLEGPHYRHDTYYVEGHERYYSESDTYAWVPGCYRTKRKKVGKGKDYNAATVKTLTRELTEGTYLVGTSGHVACLRDGEVHDFTMDRRHRVKDVYRVEES